MKPVYALFSDGHSAQRAVDRLRAAGVAEGDITVLSARPMEEYDFGRADKTTWMWHFACAGGLAGASAALGLTWVAETSWPMNVGGLPVFAWWPNLIIIFELTMLGAILTTVVALVASAGLGRTSKLYDPAVSDGEILVGVENPPEHAVREIEAALNVLTL